MTRPRIFLAIVVLGLSQVAAAENYDGRIHILAPGQGQSFRSGETFPVNLKLDPSLIGKRVFIDFTMKVTGSATGSICSEAINQGDGNFKAECHLPADAAGPAIISASAANTPPPWRSGFCAGSIDICNETKRREGLTTSAPVTIEVDPD
jgi:hypothetical protein